MSGQPSPATAPEPASAPPRARRPPAVTILALIQLASGVLLALVVLGLVVNGDAGLDSLTGNVLIVSGVARELALTANVAIIVLLSAGAVVAGVLLLRMHRLGWTITMLLAGLGLLSSIYLWWAEGARIPTWSLVQIVTVLYLNQRQVRQAFGISGRLAERPHVQDRE